jgi:TRAP transporter TAXI family solute receptor
MERRTFIASGAVLAALGTRRVHAAGERLSIGTNPVGTFYYVLGGGLAKLFTEKLGARAIVQPYAGSSVYLPQIQAGDVTMGLSSSLDSGGAYRGEQGRARNPKLRTLARMWPLRYALVVRKDAPMRSVADLKGKRVVMNFKANVSLSPIHTAVLASAGLGEKDVKGVDVTGIPAGIKGVADGSIDAAWAAVGIPVVKEAHASVGVRYLDLGGPNFTQDFLNAKVPGLFPIGIDPTPAMPEVTASVMTTGFDVFLVASADMPDAQAAKIVQTIHGAWEGLQKDYAPLRLAKASDLSRASNTVPYHAGAIGFYRGQGLWTPANDAQEKLVTLG